ncbi:S-layer homology domain-containing protein [Pseudoflavonifractor phocaeensis]|uniref:S-layer homology domain-containing protein n=1 Tax=Pseudoflavonifractor phocaeensis TaxID=1870988 RepID=UPI00195683B0|nr:S-layer homology domain-containing protein [Pseudoflavonifractor phocaeensis]MBM6925500.1 S-layer homology domain-containing protein [Pseudoflavonifractor phocaeensis]
MRRRILSLILVIAVTLSLLPVQALAKEGGPNIIINDIRVVENGARCQEEDEEGNVSLVPMPAGTSYSSGVLTLNNAALGSVLLSGGSLTVVLEGTSTIRTSSSERYALTLAESTVTFRGPGSLTVEVSGGETHACKADNSHMVVTDGASLSLRSEDTTESSPSVFDCVASSLAVEGGSTLEVLGRSGMVLTSGGPVQPTASFTNCTFTANRLSTGLESQPDLEAPTVLVGQGATMNLTAASSQESDSENILHIRAGSQFVVDGGQLNVDAPTDPQNQGSSVRVVGAGTSFQLLDGTVNAPVSGGNGIRVNEGAVFSQSGGTLTVNSNAASPALGVAGMGELTFTGGTAELTGQYGISVDEGSLTVNGGNVTALGTNGDGLSVLAAGSFTILSGQISLESMIDRSMPLMCAQGGRLNLLGGTVHLDKTGAQVVMAASGPVTLGPSMKAVDNTTGKEISLDVGEETRYLASSVTVSDSAVQAYACELSIPSGQVTQGASFTVRAVVSLGAEEGTISFPLPDGVRYVPGSLTVDSKTVTPTRTDPLTVPLDVGGAVRFTAVASDTGTKTLTANIAAGGETHQETLDFAVSAFDLSLPSRTSRLELPVSGTAVPESTVTFYEGKDALGVAQANVLGTWSGTVTLPDVEGVHTVYALLTLTDGSTIRSEDYEVTYLPETDEVETLTVTNHTYSSDNTGAILETSFVINYVTGENSHNHYTFWPELPTLEFRVDFAKDSSAQKRVTVITYNYVGEQIQVPLRYHAAEDAWIGEYDYTAYNAPKGFQVEFVPNNGSTPEQSPGVDVEPGQEPEPEEPEETEELQAYDYTDGAFAVGGPDFTFQVSDPSSLTVSDGWGQEIPFTSASTGSGYSVSPAWDGDGIYVAELDSGVFTDYPDVDQLYVVIDGMDLEAPAEVVYAEGVQFVDQLPASLTPGSVYVVGDFEEAWGVTEDGQLVEAGINNIFETLSFSQADIDTSVPPQIDGLEELEAQLTENILQSGFYSELLDLMSPYSSSAELAVLSPPEVKIVPSWKTDPTNPDKRTLALKTTLTIYLPGATATITETTSLDLLFRFNLGWGFWRETGPQEPAYLTATITEDIEADITLTTSSNPIDLLLNSYFHEDANQRILEEVGISGFWNSPSLSFAPSIPIGTTPLEFSPSISIGMEGLLYGITTSEIRTTASASAGVAYVNNTFRCFGSTSLGGAFQSTSHAVCWIAPSLRFGLNLNLLEIITAGIYSEFVVGNINIGHGKVNSQGQYKQEKYQQLAIVSRSGAEAGLTFGKKLGKSDFEFGIASLTKDFTSDNLKNTFFRKESGEKYMPTKFTVLEGAPILVTDGDRLTELVNMAMDYMDFSGLQAEEGPPDDIPTGSRVFGLDRYWFELVDQGQNSPITVSRDGIVSVNGSPQEEYSIPVKVHYTGLGDNYDLWKVVTLKYTPAKLTIYKEAEGTLPIATFLVTDETTNDTLGTYTTDAGGSVTLPVPPDHQLEIEEIDWPAGYMPLTRVKTLTTELGQNDITFINVPYEEEEPITTYIDYDTPVGVDPSGYVYEGIPSNRLSGVTTTLYYSDSETKPTKNAAESQKWDAAAFDQHNPLTTDLMGQYLWMVPDGWWQVKYEKAGYQTVYSDWLPVPPVQTDVNVGLVSTAAATLTLTCEIGQSPVLKFSRPVETATVTAQTVTITRNGSPLTGTLTPLDAGLTDDGKLCATAFRFQAAEGLQDKDALAVQYSQVMTYAGTPSGGTASLILEDPMPFADVADGAYYYDAVIWAVNHQPQITNGTNAAGTLFSPDMSCTRAQVVTFLWRAMGQPQPKSTHNPFTDVDETAYYYQAVLWAVEQGITNGTNAAGTLFSPDATCTRGQIVTFLHRTEKTPEPQTEDNPFQDVSGSAYYYDAVLWAVEIGVTNGTNAAGTFFSPDATCTRSQIVTFLYRDME